VDRDPAYGPAQVVLARCRFLAGDAQGAEEILIRLSQAEPGNPDARYNLGVLMMERGSVAAARREFGEALRLQPGHELSLKKIAVLDGRAPSASFSSASEI